MQGLHNNNPNLVVLMYIKLEEGELVDEPAEIHRLEQGIDSQSAIGISLSLVIEEENETQLVPKASINVMRICKKSLKM